MPVERRACRTLTEEEEGEAHHRYPVQEAARAGVAEARRRVSAAVKVEVVAAKVEVVAAKAVAAAVQLLLLLFLLLLLLLSLARRRADHRSPRGGTCCRNAGSTRRLAWRIAVGSSQSTGRLVRRARR